MGLFSSIASGIGGILGGPAGAIAGSAVSGLFSANQASKNRSFQADMSNTSYQRAMADMRAAGLNPILAAKLGGASTPGGAMATIPDFGQTFNSAWSNQNQQNLIGAQTEKMGAEVAKINAEIDKIAEDTFLTSVQTQKLKAEIPNVLAEFERIKADTSMKQALVALPNLIADVIRGLRAVGQVADPEAVKTRLEQAVRGLNDFGASMGKGLHDRQQRNRDDNRTLRQGFTTGGNY